MLVLTHEELLQFALVNVMWQVPNKQLMAVWVTDYSAIVRLILLHIPSPCVGGKKKAETLQLELVHRLQHTHLWSAPSMCTQNVLYLIVKRSIVPIIMY